MKGKSIFTFDDFCKVIRAFAPCMNDYLYVYDIPNDQYFISPSALDRFALPQCQFHHVGDQLREVTHPEDFDDLQADLDLIYCGIKDSHDLTYRWIGKDGYSVWINCRGRGLYDEDGKLQFLVGCINEVGNRPIADDISGLLTSIVIKDSLDKLYASSPNGFIMCIGIDDFKSINERVGIAHGDNILRGVADCIVRAVSPKQKVYRMLANEFAVVDYHGGTIETAKFLYLKIRNFVNEWIEKQNYETVYTISGGILMGKDMEHLDYDAIMKKSQFALSQAIQFGKNQVYCFDAEDYNRFLYERRILVEMRKSVANGYNGFEVHFQPIMKSGSEEIYAAESLLRFQTESGERVSPAVFIPILESSGLIIPVGKWVLDQALAMCVECQKYIPDFKVSVNLSYVQILKSDICRETDHLLDAHELTPESLIVELTESGYLETTPAVQRVWERFRDNGVMIAIDDFGTGYSNLSSIGMMQPNIVKLDRGFTVKAMQDSYEEQLMGHVIQLVHSIDLKICVEGVETTTELDAIQKLNADCIQGYYYGKPCARGAFMEQFIL